MKFKSVKIREQPIFIIENNLQKVGQPFFSLVLSDNCGTRSIFFGVSFYWYRTIGQTLMLRPEYCLGTVNFNNKYL